MRRLELWPRWAVSTLTLAVVALVVLAFVGVAHARPIPAPPPTPPVTTPTIPAPPQPQTGATGVLGNADVLQGLDAHDGACNGATGQTATNCKSTGFAGSPYPASNYGLDVNVNRGLSHPEGWVMGPLQDLLSAIWGVFVYIIAGVIAVLGAALHFDPFRQNAAQITRAIDSALTSFTWPLMAVALVIAGGVAIFHQAQRKTGKAAMHLITVFGVLAATIAILTNPATFLAPFDDLANAISSAAVAAYTPGASNGYSTAEQGLWKGAVEQPWCALEFGDPAWCMNKVTPTMAAARSDIIANHLNDALGNQDPSGQLTKQQAPLERQRMLAATTNGELFLSFITNADARNGSQDKWTLYNQTAKDPAGGAALLTIRGPGGFGNRIVILAFGSIAGLFFVATLIYIAWQIAVASLWFILMLLVGPFVVFAPILGDAGLVAFKRWASRVVGALLIKCAYSVYLGGLLALTTVALTFQLGWFLDWMVLALVWALGWFKRKALLDLLSGGHHQHHAHGDPVLVGALAGRWAARQGWARHQMKQAWEAADSASNNNGNGGGDTNYHLHLHGDRQPSNGHHPERVPNISGDLEGHVNELGSGEE